MIFKTSKEVFISNTKTDYAEKKMIYITGDKHGELKSLNLIPSTKGDKIVIAGDFGVIWNKSDWAERNEKTQIELAKNKNCEILFVDGNHENFTRINKLAQIDKFGGRVGVYTDNIFHLKYATKEIIPCDLKINLQLI